MLSGYAQGGNESLPLPDSFRSELASAGVPLSHVSVVVRRLDRTGASRNLSWNAEMPRHPASLIKLVTAYAALAFWGPGKTWVTTLDAMPPQEGVIDGAICVRGVGDPDLSLERWGTMWRRLRQIGVNRLQGDLVIDQGAYTDLETDTDRFDHRGIRSYNTLPRPLQVGGQSVVVNLVPESGTVALWTEFPFPGLDLVNQVRLNPSPCTAGWRSRMGYIQTRTAVGRTVLRFEGDYPEGCGHNYVALNPLDDLEYLGESFKGLWHEMGGGFGGKVITAAEPAGLKPLIWSVSPALADIVRKMNKNSDNLMARTLFLDLSMDQNGRNANLERSRDRLKSILDDHRLDFPELMVENGAGLSRKTQISATHLADLLENAARGPFQAEFESSLPIPGTDGTLTDEFREQSDGWVFHLKSGTLDQASGLAGYGTGPAGQRMIVVIMVNDVHATATRPAQWGLLKWLAITQKPE